MEERRGEFLLQNCKLLQIGILRLVECLMAQYMNCFLQLMELFVRMRTPKRKKFWLYPNNNRFWIGIKGKL